MELDDFKQLYKAKDELETIPHSAAELEGYMRSKTHSITGKIKRSIWFEAALYILFIIAAVWIWIKYSSRLVSPFCILTIILCGILFLYLAALYKKIAAYEKTPPVVKNSLQQIIAIVQRFIRLYFQFTMITVPILFVFGLFALYMNVSGDVTIKRFNWIRGLLFYTGWFVTWWAVMYFFTSWYIKKLYGGYLNQLKQQLKDIENG